jgi:hypothetical protein
VLCGVWGDDGTFDIRHTTHARTRTSILLRDDGRLTTDCVRPRGVRRRSPSHARPLLAARVRRVSCNKTYKTGLSLSLRS